jgi:hypothetical protein
MTCDQQRFERDIADHVMTIVRDDGVDRHIKFRDKDGGSPYWFEILTWPGALCIRGDCGTYVFSRLTDMFEFFRPKYERVKEGELFVNPSYWLEKMIASDSNGRHPSAVEELDEKAFKARVHEEIDQYLGIDTGECDYPGELVCEIKRDLRSQVFDEVHSSTSPNEAHRLIYDFSYEDPKGKMHWPFAETESVPRRYSFHTMWNLYAISWAIRQYDAAKAEKQAA